MTDATERPIDSAVSESSAQHDAARDRISRDESAAEAQLMFHSFRVQLGFPYPNIAGLEQLTDPVLDCLTRRECIAVCGAVWVKARLNATVIGPPKSGKTTVACAMGAAALAAGEWPRYITASDCTALMTRAALIRPIWGQLESDVLDTELVIVDDFAPEELTSVQCEALLALLSARRDVSTLLVVQELRSAPFDQLRWPGAGKQLAAWFAAVHFTLRLGRTDPDRVSERAR